MNVAGWGMTQTHRPTKQEEPTKRLSIDMPASLHRRFKVACAKHSLSMVGEALEFFPASHRRTREELMGWRRGGNRRIAGKACKCHIVNMTKTRVNPRAAPARAAL